MKKVLGLTFIAAALVLQGCASTGQTTGQTTGTNSALKSSGLGALAGAAAGAIIGSATGSEKVGRDAIIGAVVGGLGGYVWNAKMEKQRAELEKATAGTGIDVVRTEDNQLKLEIPADAGFAVGQANIQPRLQTVLNTFANTLQSNNTTKVRIVGHTDNTGSDASNEPLSLRRAESTRNYLTSKGVSSSRFTTEGMGSRAPIASNSSESGRAQNRRVEVFVAQASN